MAIPLLLSALLNDHLTETGDHYILRRIKQEPMYDRLLHLCQKQIEYAKSNIERIRLVKSMLSSLVDKEFDEQVANMKPKDADKAEQLRQKGNYEYKKKNYTEAHELYTESIAEAPMKSNQLALGFANRSAVLRAMGKFSESLADIQHAFDCDYPECQRYKLFLRQGQSHRDLGDKDKAAKSFKMARDNLLHASALCETEKKRILAVLEKEEKAKKVKPASKEVLYDRPVPSVTYGQNKVAPSFSSAVDIQYCEKSARKVVLASRDIKTGDFLLVEQFFGSIIEVHFILTFCSFCIKRCFNLLPCPECRYVLYCSEKCCTEAKELYHREECPALCKLVAVEKTFLITENARLTTHVIARAGVENWQKFVAEQTSSPTAQKMKGFNSEGKYLADDLNALYHLSSNAFVKEMLISKTLLALLYMKCFGLDHVTNYDEIAASFLQLLLSVPLNQLIYILPELSMERDYLACNEIRSAGVLSFGYGLLNHSCDRNTNYLFNGRHLIVRALKPIKKGEQVTTSYTNAFYEISREQRQDNLKFVHNIICSCKACTYDYPTYPHLPEQPSIMNMYLALREEQRRCGNPLFSSKRDDFQMVLSNHASFLPVLYDFFAKLYREGKHMNQSYLKLQTIVVHTFYADSTFYHVQK